MFELRERVREDELEGRPESQLVCTLYGRSSRREICSRISFKEAEEWIVIGYEDQDSMGDHEGW